MRVLRYEMDLMPGCGYDVLCKRSRERYCSHENYAEDVGQATSEEIKMSPTMKRRRMHSMEQKWDMLIANLDREFIAGRENAYEPGDEEYELAQSFLDRSLEVARGTYDAFKLSDFRVMPTYILLIYTDRTGMNLEFRHRINPYHEMDITFVGPRNRLGFEPTYRVWCNSRGEMFVEDDQGDKWHDIALTWRGTGDDEHVHLEITEYTDI